MDDDVEPALEATDFIDNDVTHRLNLLYLKVDYDASTDEEVGSKKRSRIKRNAKKNKIPKSTVSSTVSSSSPPPPDNVLEDDTTEQSEIVSKDETNVSASVENVNCNSLNEPQSSQATNGEPDEDEVTETPTDHQNYFSCDIFKLPKKSNSHRKNQADGSLVKMNGTEPQTLEYDYSKPICLGNNARCRVMIDIFPSDAIEEIRDTFMSFKGSLLGVHHRPPLVFLLVTNKALYLMNHVHESALFSLEAKMYFSKLRNILIETTSPGLTFVTDTETSPKIEVCCASHDLMNTIVQSVTSSCRYNGYLSPQVVTDSSSAKLVEKSIAKYLNVDVSEIKIKHSVSVFFGRIIDETHRDDLDSTELIENFDEGSFGLKEGMLMYQLIDEDVTPNGTWLPGYFVLADGYLYCYTDATKNHLRFFGQLFNNHCKGCRRVNDDESLTRPHVIELRMVIDNVVQFLFLAASNESDTTDWMMNLLTSVNLESPEDIGHFDGKNCLEKFCLLVLTEDALFTLVRDVSASSYHVLDHVNICDVMATVRSADDPSTSLTFLVVEFESSQTSNSREWTLYFLTRQECDTFFRLLSQTWEELFQVPLQCLILDRVSRIDDSSEASVAQQTLSRLHSWHRNAVSIML